ncbi:hypothetical protein NQ314_015920 [Rhamnusium bicolor]|uniref:Menorin-like domain-containing protein n=1 Tax=Rhamnusium bicolor TaxID=1586634 RepID=A0AAV8WYB7_9CUCU|nr:hypothetical protein NQ314_015920 [Rhamnusium bicolor]
MMIEADIILGLLNGSGSLIPVMGHPPNNHSDLSLATFLDTINKFNINATNTTTRKGVKLDFKTIEVFNQSVDIVRLFNQGNYPLWINADILPGPINATTVPVDAAQFFANARQFNNTVLSVGWTTNFGSNLTGSYTTDHINSMLSVIRQNNVTQNITFPVRAGLAAESAPQMKTLLTNVTGSTLTLWSSEGDNVNVTKLRSLIGEIGIEKIYIDVLESLRRQLRLQDLSSSASAIASTFVISVFITIMASLM